MKLQMIEEQEFLRKQIASRDVNNRTENSKYYGVVKENTVWKKKIK